LKRLLELEGVEIVAWRDGTEAGVRSSRGELRFAPEGDVADRRGAHWRVEGSLDAIEARVRDGALECPSYPDALGRLWAALACEGAGEVLISAAPEYEFTDWGGANHAGGGSHGSLGEGDSLVPLVFLDCGPDLDARDGDGEREWSITDVAPLVLEHFGV
jgi:hypothetical protein